MTGSYTACHVHIHRVVVGESCVAKIARTKTDNGSVSDICRVKLICASYVEYSSVF